MTSLRPPNPLLVSGILLALLGISAGAVGPDDPEPAFARKFCAEQKNPADSIAYYPNGGVRADIACAPGGGYVSAQFYNERGQLTRTEHQAPGLNGQHNVELYAYPAGGPAWVSVYDANGNLLQTREAGAPGIIGGGEGGGTSAPGNTGDGSSVSLSGPRGSPEEYAAVCRTNAPYYQRFLLGEVKPLEFDVDKACDCIARRLVNADPASAPGGQTLLEQVDEVAMVEPKSCICPNARPGSSLEKNCRQR